ncbi:MAG: hypothetical protein V2B14_06535 [bacterium]
MLERLNIITPLQRKYHNANLIALNKNLIVPALAIGSLFSMSEKNKDDLKKHTYLINNITGACLSVFLRNMKDYNWAKNDWSMLPLAAVSTIAVRASGKETKYDKIASVIKDTVWLGCGLAFKALFSNKFWGPKPSSVFGFLSDVCAFIVGAIVVSPVVNKFLIKNFLDPNVSKLDSKMLRKLDLQDQSPLPISLDKYNTSRITMPESYIKYLKRPN